MSQFIVEFELPWLSFPVLSEAMVRPEFISTNTLRQLKVDLEAKDRGILNPWGVRLDARLTGASELLEAGLYNLARKHQWLLHLRWYLLSK